MIGGLLAGAMAGGAEAAQDNARTRIKQMHDDAILRMQQQFASSEREAGQQFSREERIGGQEFSRGERVAGQEFTAGENQANRSHDLTLTQMREAGANSRSAASRQQQPQWQMLPDGNGGYIQYDPVSNQYRDANLPEGVSFDGSELTDREKLTIETLADERKSIMETSMGQPSEQQAARLGEIDSRMEQLLGDGATTGGGDLATRLARQLGINPDDAPEQQEADTPSSPPPAGGGAPPPRPGQAPQANTQEAPGNFGGLINQALADQGQQQAARQDQAQQRQIEREINTIRGLAARAGQGPGMTQADRDALGRQAIEQAEALMQQGNLTSEQIQRLRAAAENVVRYTELEFN